MTNPSEAGVLAVWDTQMQYAICADHDFAAQEYADMAKARATIAEYIAANEEYDAAFTTQYPKKTIIARRNAARTRRAAAHAAMKGVVS